MEDVLKRGVRCRTNPHYEFNGSFVSYVFSLVKTDDFSVRRPVEMLHQQPLGTRVVTTPLLPHLRPFWLMVRNRHTLGSVAKPWFVQIRGVGAARHHFETAFTLLHFKKSSDQGRDRPNRPNLIDQQRSEPLQLS